MSAYLDNGKFIIRTLDSAWIPKDPNNSDYQNFQAWQALGNTATPTTEGILS